MASEHHAMPNGGHRARYARIWQQLQPLTDPKLLRRLFRLPDELYHDAGTQLADGPVRAARIHEQGLLLHVLQEDPMHCTILAALNIETNLLRDEQGWITGLYVPADRSMNCIAIETPLSDALGERIRTHLTVYRPHLRGADSPWLFPSPWGKPRSPRSVAIAVRRVVRQRIGVTFTPRLARHLLATLLSFRGQSTARQDSCCVTPTPGGRR